MKSKATILRRITVLYVIFFAVIAFGLYRSISRLAGDGFNIGHNDAERILNENLNDRYVGIIYDLKVSAGEMDLETPIYSSQSDSIVIYSRPSSFDAEVISPRDRHFGMGNAAQRTVFMLSTLTYASVFIILFIIIGSLRKSIRKDNLFKKSNIALTRAIGILLIAASLLFSLLTWMEAKSIEPYLADTAYAINTGFPFNFSELIMGVVVFVIAEIFSISSLLSEDQKLTI